MNLEDLISGRISAKTVMYFSSQEEFLRQLKELTKGKIETKYYYRWNVYRCKDQVILADFGSEERPPVIELYQYE